MDFSVGKQDTTFVGSCDSSRFYNDLHVLCCVDDIVACHISYIGVVPSMIERCSSFTVVVMAWWWYSCPSVDGIVFQTPHLRQAEEGHHLSSFFAVWVVGYLYYYLLQKYHHLLLHHQHPHLPPLALLAHCCLKWYFMPILWHR